MDISEDEDEDQTYKKQVKDQIPISNLEIKRAKYPNNFVFNNEDGHRTKISGLSKNLGTSFLKFRFWEFSIHLIIENLATYIINIK